QLQPAGSAGSSVTINAVTNGASNVSGAIAPGEIVTLYGTGLGPLQLTQFTGAAVPTAGGRAGSVIFEAVPTTLASTRVLFNGTAAPVLYTWTNQVGGGVPYGVTGS